MAKVSVLIPSRNEQFLNPTVDSLFERAAGDIEVIVCVDGYTEHLDVFRHKNPNLHVLYEPSPIGMRRAINACAALATGDYLMKLDAHCLVDYGFDEVLKADCDGDWIVVPRRYSLDAEKWEKTQKTPKDYHYLCYPYRDGYERLGGLHGLWWRQRSKDRAHIEIDDEMTSQGSGWFMSRGHFFDFLGGMHTEGYGHFIQEFQELGMKTWLGGGQVKINKKTWYAHLHKGKRYGRGYFIGKNSWRRGMDYSTDLWVNNKWAERVHDLEWLVEKFWPVPTWDDDWRVRLGY